MISKRVLNKNNKNTNSDIRTQTQEKKKKNQKPYITQSACEKVTWVLYVFNASYGLPAPVEDTLQFFLEKTKGLCTMSWVVPQPFLLEPLGRTHGPIFQHQSCRGDTDTQSQREWICVCVCWSGFYHWGALWIVEGNGVLGFQNHHHRVNSPFFSFLFSFFFLFLGLCSYI